jgi:hypothetical protein
MLYWIVEILRRARRADAARDCTVREMTAVERTRLDQARELARQRAQEWKAKKRARRKDSAS